MLLVVLMVFNLLMNLTVFADFIFGLNKLAFAEGRHCIFRYYLVLFI